MSKEEKKKKRRGEKREDEEKLTGSKISASSPRGISGRVWIFIRR